MDGPPLPVAGTRWPETTTVTVVRGQGPRAEGLVRPRSWGLLVKTRAAGKSGGTIVPTNNIFSFCSLGGGKLVERLYNL